MSDIDADLTPEEMRTAEALLDSALEWRALPDYSPGERLVLATLAAHLSRQQRIKGKKSKNAQKLQAENRRGHVNLLLRYVVKQKYRDDPNSLKTVMEIVDWLDAACDIEASDTQVRRDIHAVLELGPPAKLGDSNRRQ
jgi:hypothetical protein